MSKARKSTPKGITVKVRNITESEMCLEIGNVDTYFVNALRRILLAEIPTMAAETLRVVKNTTIVQDEMIAHRLGLIPLRATEDALMSTDVGMSLSFECQEDEPVSVYAKDLELSDGIEVACGDILLAKMTRGQELVIEVDCRKGTGREHCKWSPVCHAGFRPTDKARTYIFNIETVGSMTPDDAFLASLKILEEKFTLTKKLS